MDPRRGKYTKIDEIQNEDNTIILILEVSFKRSPICAFMHLCCDFVNIVLVGGLVAIQ